MWRNVLKSTFGQCLSSCTPCHLLSLPCCMFVYLLKSKQKRQYLYLCSMLRAQPWRTRIITIHMEIIYTLLGSLLANISKWTVKELLPALVYFPVTKTTLYSHLNLCTKFAIKCPHIINSTVMVPTVTLAAQLLLRDRLVTVMVNLTTNDRSRTVMKKWILLKRNGRRITLLPWQHYSQCAGAHFTFLYSSIILFMKMRPTQAIMISLIFCSPGLGFFRPASHQYCLLPGSCLMQQKTDSWDIFDSATGDYQQPICRYVFFPTFLYLCSQLHSLDVCFIY